MNSSGEKNLVNTSDLKTVGDLVRWGSSRLSEAGVFFGHGTDNAADEARVLVFHALHLDFDVPDYFYQCRVTEPERQSVTGLLDQRIETRMPAPYLTGEAWFAGLRFAVDKRVLIPRSPLAELILSGFDPWLAMAEPSSILDLCTGSGCIAIACAHVFTNADVDAVDIDEGALEVARENVQLHDLEQRVSVIKSDVFEGLHGRKYDVIVSNPPYVPAASMALLPSEYQSEPERALLAEQDGLEIVNRIMKHAADHLTPNGILIVEVGESMPAVMAGFTDLPLNWIEFEHGGEGVFVISAEDLRSSDMQNTG